MYNRRMKTKQNLLKRIFTPQNGICVTYKTIKADCKMHFHDFYEIDIITDGAGSSNFNGKEIKFGKNSAFFLTTKDFHDITPDTDLKITNIQFSNDVVKKCFGNAPLKGGYTFYDDETTKDVDDLCGLLSRAGSKAKYANSLLVALIQLLFASANFPEPKDAGKNFMRDVLSFVNDHFRENPSLNTLSELFDRSPNYISSQFTLVTGENYKSYLKRLKLDAALKLLVLGDMSVTDVCYECGYETISHFNREFRAYYGRTPREVRNSPDRSI